MKLRPQSFRTLGIVVLAALPAYGQHEAEELFDGRSLDGWTVLDRANGEGTWIVEDGLIVPIGKPGDLATSGSFGDFELEVEWRLAELGNSGIIYRAREGVRPSAGSIEYQLADNAREPSQRYPDRRNGAIYGLYAPTEDASRPVGEWNTSRIVARGRHVEHWLNGKMVAKAEIGSADWRERVSRSKFAKVDGYGEAEEGSIVLQSHGDRGVAFRGVRIRRL